MPQSSRFEHAGATLRVEPLTEAVGPLRLVWLHGWGQNREAMRPLAQAFLDVGENWLVDMPGFGEAPPPPSAYTPADYARLVNAWLQQQPACPTVFIGHSFGFHVALNVTHQVPQNVVALVSLAGAGAPRKLNPLEKLRRQYIKFLLKAANFIKPLVGEGPQQALRQRFGSRDYLAAGEAMRPTFVATVNASALPLCPSLRQPTLLLYGLEDTETPPSVAHRFKQGLPNATVTLLPHVNHYNILQGSRHVVERLVRDFLLQHTQPEGSR